MDSQARHELSKAIQKEGTGLYEDPQRIKALLMDACPESRTEISLLVSAVEDEIPIRLARASDSVLRDGEIARAIADLKRTRRLDHGAAEWVVRSWAWALGVLDREPSDDPVEADAGVPVPGPAAPDPQLRPPHFMGTSPYPADPSGPPQQHPSLPPGYPVSPPGSQHASMPPVGHPSQPWSSGGFPSTPSGGQPSWSQGGPSVPGSQGFAGGGGYGGPPPVPGWPPVAPPPPNRGRGRMVAVIGVAVALVLLTVGGVAWFMRPPSDSAGPSGTRGSSAPSIDTQAGATTPEPTSDQAAAVTVTITNNLASYEVAENATVYTFGKQIGTLKINDTSPTAELQLPSDTGNVDYQLQITMFLTDAAGGGQRVCNGAGSITAYEGARYFVDIKWGNDGSCAASLSAQQGI